MPGLGSEILENLSKYKILSCPPHLQPTLQPGTFLRHGEPGAQLCGLAAVETAVGGGLNTDGDLGPVVGSQLTPHGLPGAVTGTRARHLDDLPRLVETPGLDLAALPNDGGDQCQHLPAQLGAGVGDAVLRVALAQRVDLARLGPTHPRLLPRPSL